MDINSKETLHQALDEMIEKHTGKPTDIALCEQQRKYDDSLYWWGEYEGLRVVFYPEWFSEGKIKIK